MTHQKYGWKCSSLVQVNPLQSQRIQATNHFSSCDMNLCSQAGRCGWTKGKLQILSFSSLYCTHFEILWCKHSQFGVLILLVIWKFRYKVTHGYLIICSKKPHRDLLAEKKIAQQTRDDNYDILQLLKGRQGRDAKRMFSLRNIIVSFHVGSEMPCPDLTKATWLLCIKYRIMQHLLLWCASFKSCTSCKLESHQLNTQLHELGPH